MAGCTARRCWCAARSTDWARSSDGWRFSAGYLIAYLNIDEVIRIIREGGRAQAELIARFSLTDVQAEAILNMRLRALRKLEEIEIRKEFDALPVKRPRSRRCWHPRKQWKLRLAHEIRSSAQEVRPRDRTRQAPHQFCRCAGHRSRCHSAGHDREGAGHRRSVGKGLGARPEGPCERFVA